LGAERHSKVLGCRTFDVRPTRLSISPAKIKAPSASLPHTGQTHGNHRNLSLVETTAIIFLNYQLLVLSLFLFLKTITIRICSFHSAFQKQYLDLCVRIFLALTHIVYIHHLSSFKMETIRHFTTTEIFSILMPTFKAFLPLLVGMISLLAKLLHFHPLKSLSSK
jgi:hypothetical protein